MKYHKKPLAKILRLSNSVFTFKEVSLIWEDTNKNSVISAINYYVKKGDLYRIRRGIYAKDKDYDRLELAVKIYTPSYISFETVLSKAGIIFQYYNQIFVASYLTRQITIDNQVYSYKKIKEAILTNSIGIETKDGYPIASAERAFLDVLYLYKNYHFDNLSSLNWKKVYQILPIYNNRSLEEKLKSYVP